MTGMHATRRTNYLLGFTAVGLGVNVLLFAYNRWLWLAQGLLLFAGWRLMARWVVAAQPTEQLEPPHVAQLRTWCRRLRIDMPEIIKHQRTDTGERYDLRVTGDDEDGKVMTPEMFRTYWQRFRSVAGDGCRGVFISPPDPANGGRCSMTVVWKGAGPKPPSRFPVPVQLGEGHIHMCYDANELYFALAEAEAKGIVQEVPTWAAPNPAEMAGER